VARRVLLDALEALGPHRDALIVAGAQAIYLQAGAGRLPISDYTTDGDLALDPAKLPDAPLLSSVMEEAGFTLAQPDGVAEPGIWTKQAIVNGVATEVPVDLIVPSGVAPRAGRRGARLTPHGSRAARKAVGLEGALLDNQLMRIGSLEELDRRAFPVRVAGKAALFVSKLHKLADRADEEDAKRLFNKDASDVVQIMRSVLPRELAETLVVLRADPIAGPPTEAAMTYLQDLFGNRAALGISMAADALRRAVPEERIRTICLAYVAELERALGEVTEPLAGD
jgi:hypothetical protein